MTRLMLAIISYITMGVVCLARTPSFCIAADRIWHVPSGVAVNAQQRQSLASIYGFGCRETEAVDGRTRLALRPTRQHLLHLACRNDPSVSPVECVLRRQAADEEYL
jgi:hypothetical protein